jgi:hypothetical protein
MVTLLAWGTVADVHKQLGHELVTLLALVGRQLVPHRTVGTGHGILRQWKRRKMLVHHALLLVVIHKA